MYLLPYQVSTLLGTQEGQKEPSVSIQKCRFSYWPGSDGQKKQKGPVTRPKMAPLWKKSVFAIGPPSWIKKEINANSLRHGPVSTTISRLNKIKLHSHVELLGTSIRKFSQQCSFPYGETVTNMYLLSIDALTIGNICTC
jgi:hypothetical protein